MLTHSQRAMIYLVAKGLKQSDFCKFMHITPQRGSQLLDWRNTARLLRKTEKRRWSEENRQKALLATNHGLDVFDSAWEKIEKILDRMTAPILDDNSSDVL